MSAQGIACARVESIVRLAIGGNDDRHKVGSREGGRKRVGNRCQELDSGLAAPQADRSESLQALRQNRLE